MEERTAAIKRHVLRWDRPPSDACATSGRASASGSAASATFLQNFFDDVDLQVAFSKQVLTGEDGLQALAVAEAALPVCGVWRAGGS